MDQSRYAQNTRRLRQLMERAAIANFQQLSQISGVSQWQIARLRAGLLPKMPLETLLPLAEALQIPLSRLVNQFSPESVDAHSQALDAELKSLKKEYERLRQQMQQQRQVVKAEFEQSSLQTLESWLLQWPTAAAAVEKNPDLPGTRLLPLIKPVEKLLQQWGVKAIGSVGEEISYDPQQHQLIEGTAQPGDPVKVRYVGYQQGEKLLFRAKVSPVIA